MLNLSSVTLVAINTVCHELSDMAVAECLKHANFGDVKVFTNRHEADKIYIEPFNDLIEAGNFTYYEVPKYITTDRALFIHWDSWIIDPPMWTDDFLYYDYVGAPWWYTDGLNVGNSGFCLRSKRMIDFFAENRETYPFGMPEDVMLCKHYRPMLPQFKWAPEPLAAQFSFERARAAVDSRHFGFHGMFNWPFVLTPDKLAERMEIARKDSHILKSKDLDEIDGLAQARWLKLSGRID